MRAGSRKYRTMMARLDEAGITANIVRVGRNWYELHVNFQIVTAAKSRATCNRHLVKLLESHYPPPISETLKLQILMFFQQLIALDPKLDLQFRAMADANGAITVSLTPANIKNIRPLIITGTAAELDAGLIGAIRQPIESIGGLSVTNAEAFQEDLDKSKGGAGKTATKTASTSKPAPKKDAVQSAETGEIPKPGESKDIQQNPAESAQKPAEQPQAAPQEPEAVQPAAPAPPAPPKPAPPRPAAPTDQLFAQ